MNEPFVFVVKETQNGFPILAGKVDCPNSFEPNNFSVNGDLSQDDLDGDW